MSKTPKVNTAYFKSALDAVDLSFRGLARKWGVDPANVSRMLTGKREMRMSEASKLAALTGKPLAEVLENAGMAGVASHAPVVGYADGHGVARIDWSARERVAPRPADGHERLVAIELRTVGSKYELADGWLAYAQAPKGIEPGVIGKPSIVKVRGSKSGPQVAIVRKGYQAGRYTLISPDNSVISDAELEYATPILWFRTDPA